MCRKMIKGVLDMTGQLHLLETETTSAANINDQWGLIGSTLVTGLVVVFLILAILVLFLWLFGKIFGVINNRSAGGKKKKNEKNAPASPAVSSSSQTAAVNPSAVVIQPEDDSGFEEEDDEEIIAVIAAAIAAFGEAEGKQYRIASIKRTKNARSGWSSAGIADNMRSFLD